MGHLECALDSGGDGGCVPLRERFPAHLPRAPLFAADSYKNGIALHDKKGFALKRRHVQFNPDQGYFWLAIDVDRPAHWIEHEGDLPPASVKMVNPANGHGHLAYLLDRPVWKTGPEIKRFRQIRRGMTFRLDGDSAFSGWLLKNPLHSSWQTFWQRDDPYRLEDLGACLSRDDFTAPLRRGSMDTEALRNELRARAFAIVYAVKKAGADFDHCLRLVAEAALEINNDLEQGLPTSVLRSLAQSTCGWVWPRTDPGRLQTARTKRWAGHVADSRTEPWKGLGISRRTYFRRKRSGTL